MLTIHYFGEIAEKTGLESEKLNFRNLKCSVLMHQLQEKYNLNKGDFQVAVNHNLIDLSIDREIYESDEIALLSAFAGG